jgi:hypothetical protein
MTRLLDLGLVTLLVSTVAIPATQAAPQSSNQPASLQSQPTQPQSPHPARPQVGAVRVQTTKPQTVQQANGQVLSERDRLILERQTQQLIPPQD